MTDTQSPQVVAPTARAVLTYLVRAIVGNPDEVSVEVAPSDDPDTTLLVVHTAKDDVGRIIGKRGHVINSIRTVVRAAGAKDDTTVDVDVAED